MTVHKLPMFGHLNMKLSEELTSIGLKLAAAKKTVKKKSKRKLVMPSHYNERIWVTSQQPGYRGAPVVNAGPDKHLGIKKMMDRLPDDPETLLAELNKLGVTGVMEKYSIGTMTLFKAVQRLPYHDMWKFREELALHNKRLRAYRGYLGAFSKAEDQEFIKVWLGALDAGLHGKEAIRSVAETMEITPEEAHLRIRNLVGKDNNRINEILRNKRFQGKRVSGHKDVLNVRHYESPAALAESLDPDKHEVIDPVHPVRADRFTMPVISMATTRYPARKSGPYEQVSQGEVVEMFEKVMKLLKTSEVINDTEYYISPQYEIQRIPVPPEAEEAYKVLMALRVVGALLMSRYKYDSHNSNVAAQFALKTPALAKYGEVLQRFRNLQNQYYSRGIARTKIPQIWVTNRRLGQVLKELSPALKRVMYQHEAK